MMNGSYEGLLAGRAKYIDGIKKLVDKFAPLAFYQKVDTFQKYISSKVEQIKEQINIPKEKPSKQYFNTALAYVGNK